MNMRIKQLGWLNLLLMRLDIKVFAVWELCAIALLLTSFSSVQAAPTLDVIGINTQRFLNWIRMRMFLRSAMCMATENGRKTFSSGPSTRPGEVWWNKERGVHFLPALRTAFSD